MADKPTPGTAPDPEKIMQERCDTLYKELQNEAAETYVSFVLGHTPADLQELMKKKIQLPPTDSTGDPPADAGVKALVEPAPEPAHTDPKSGPAPRAGRAGHQPTHSS